MKPATDQFGGIAIEEPKPTAPQTDQFGGIAVDAANEGGFLPHVTKAVGDAASATGEFISEQAGALKRWATGAETEDFPEIPVGTSPSLTGDFQLADTPIGQLNALKKSPLFKDKKLRLSTDKFDNPIVMVDGKPHYFNKPAPSANDYDFVMKGIQEFAPLIVGGGASAALKTVPGMAMTGLSGMTGEAIAQMGAEGAGAEEGFDFEKMALTGAFSAGGEGAGRLIVKTLTPVIKAIFGKSAALSKYYDGDKFTKEGIRLLKENEVSPTMIQSMMRDEMKRKGVLTAEQAERYNQFMDAGMKPTKAQITQNADDFMFQQQQLKNELGKPLRGDLDVQNSQMLVMVDDAAAKAGGGARSPEEAGTGLVDFVTAKALSHDARIGAMYRAARDSAPKSKDVSLSGLLNTIKQNRGQDAMSNGAIRGIYSDLKLRGVISPDGKLQGRVSVETAEEIRKLMNTLYAEGNPTARRLMTKLKSSLDDDVFRIAGKDVFKQARGEKIAFHKEYTDAQAHKLNTRSKNVLERLYDGSITPDKAFNAVVKSGPLKEMQRVKQSLTTGMPDEVAQGTQIWNDLRTQVIRNALDDATKGGRNELGDIVFNAKLFENSINRYQGSGKLKVLFEPAELTEIGKIIRIGQLRTPTVGTAIGQGPSSAAIQAATRLMGKTKAGQMALGASQGLKGFADDAAIKSGVEEARFPAAQTLKNITQLEKAQGKMRSLPAKVGGIGGLSAMGALNKDQLQRTRR